MPVKSQAQNRLFHWAAAHPGAAAQRGIKPGVAEEFIADQAPGSVKRLPMRVGPKAPAGTKSIGRKPFGSWAV